MLMYIYIVSTTNLMQDASPSSNIKVRHSVSQFLFSRIVPMVFQVHKSSLSDRKCTWVKEVFLYWWMIQSLASSNNRYSNPLAILNRLWSDRKKNCISRFLKNGHVKKYLTFAVVGGTIVDWYLIGRIGFSQILQINSIVWIIKLGRKLFLS